jgi:hypothetical protein
LSYHQRTSAPKSSALTLASEGRGYAHRPADDYWHEPLNADWKAARAYGELSGRSAAVREIEALWDEIDHLNDALKGRAPRGVTLN